MKEVILSQGAVALVDDADFDFINQWKWTLIIKPNGARYAKRSIYTPEKRSVMMHRVLMGLKDPKIQVDHIDRDGLNNQRSNLRVATQSQNNVNRRRKKNATNEYLGVYSSISRRNPFRARLQLNGKKLELGNYPNKEQAALAYNVGAKKHFGEFAVFNNLCAQSIPK